jgi:phage shock protein C
MTTGEKAMSEKNIRRLTRSRTERMIGGVCGGLGAYLEIDPTLIRLLFVLGLLFGGHGLLLYLVLLLVMPIEPIELASA